MSDTPETDKYPLWHGEPAVHIDFARKLERERDEARNIAQDLWTKNAKQANEILKLKEAIK